MLSEVENLVQRGYFDFSFIAQDTSSYLMDLNEKNGLIKLIKEIEKIDGVKAARILYLYPNSVSFKLLETIINSAKFVNYFDMPLQHISSKMLKIMRRNFNKNRLFEFLKIMREAPNSFLRTSFIVGHPGEGEVEFNELCEFIESFNFDRISIFGYSKEEQTPAFHLPQIPQKITNSRLKIIEKITNLKIQKSLQNEVGKLRDVVCTGLSSEGEFFVAGKDLRWMWI